MTESDETFRLELERDFVRDNQTRLGEITEAIGAGDLTLAHRLTHSLKANAGLIGRTGLQKAAAEMESLLKDGKNFVEEKHRRLLEIELGLVLKELAPLLEDAGTVTRTEPFEKAEALRLLEKLEPLLKSGNPECLNFAEDVRGMPGGSKLAAQMEDFDFAPALASLTKLKKEWDKT